MGLLWVWFRFVFFTIFRGNRDRVNISIVVQIIEIDKQLFEMEEAKYERNEIPPSEFLKIKRGVFGEKVSGEGG